MTAPLLFEIGCEEIPARMIPGAARDLGQRIEAILDQAAMKRGPTSVWGGSRRLAVRVEDVEERQADREELVLGPPARAAFGPNGEPTGAAIGFARKQGIEPSTLARITTEKGEYAGFRRQVRGKSLGEILGEALPPAVEGMPFPKTMRWGDGRFRWVRPVHWLLLIHGSEALPVEIFGVRAAPASGGHRFLAPGPVEVRHPDLYAAALLAAFVVADPGERRRLLTLRLNEAASASGGQCVDDESLLEEVVDLVEWPGVVTGRFDPAFLDLPREILVTTLRHHQKAFSVQSDGRLLPVFLAIANTDRDPAGHVARGNGWVVVGRLEDARFFWVEDRKRPLASRVPSLEVVAFHKKAGSYLDKVRRTRQIAEALARRLDLPASSVEAAGRAAELSKADLGTGLVGEFPELQGVVGGLLLRHERENAAVADAVYEHYRPQGPDDRLPESEIGAIVSVADKLDTVASLLRAGEVPTGSRDPFGLRRATAGIFRIAFERAWPLSLDHLWQLSAESTGRKQRDEVFGYLEQRFNDHLRERGFTVNEVNSVMQVRGDLETGASPFPDVLARFDAVRTVRDRSDFRRLVELTKRTWNITKQTSHLVLDAGSRGWTPGPRGPWDPAAEALEERLGSACATIEEAADGRRYTDVLDQLAQFVQPVSRFFDQVLVVDAEDLTGTYYRHELLSKLGALLIRYFDIRELPGEADRRS
ncbi:MAG: glycine--tRNA ligase subunit beta [Acidobacteriia bacterium]|nr:glycine--tRNA ligase subunit beta [Terriglobia bacterium]